MKLRKPKLESLEHRQLMAVDATMFLDLPQATTQGRTPWVVKDHDGFVLDWTVGRENFTIRSDGTAEGTGERQRGLRDIGSSENGCPC